MQKETLTYVPVIDAGGTYGKSISPITCPLAASRRVRLPDDSEILRFQVQQQEGIAKLLVGITQVDAKGNNGPLIMYGEELSCAPRTRFHYKGVPLRVQTELHHTDEYASSIQNLIQSYLTANPDPYARIAVVTAPEEFADETQQLFNSLAEPIAHLFPLNPLPAESIDGICQVSFGRI